MSQPQDLVQRARFHVRRTLKKLRGCLAPFRTGRIYRALPAVKDSNVIGETLLDGQAM